MLFCYLLHVILCFSTFMRFQLLYKLELVMQRVSQRYFFDHLSVFACLTFMHLSV